jgi:DNA-binding FadR family transcriptional regulator
MPIKIKETRPLVERLAEFAKTIKDGEGWSRTELCEIFGASRTPMCEAMEKLPCLSMLSGGRIKKFLVNAKTHKNHAAKN